MAAPRVRAHYEQLNQIARQFGEHGNQAQQTLNQLRQQMDVLQGGDWLGNGAKAFYAEMNQAILPTLRRLANALQAAQRVTQQISGEMKSAEDAAAACFRLQGAAGALAGAAAAGPAGAAKPGLLDRALDALGGTLGTIGFGLLGSPLDALGEKLGIGAIATDITRGVIDEGADMIGGLWHLATSNPIDTIKGMAYGVAHPGLLWDAFKKPYVEAWESGHPGRAVGRGALFVASFFVGAGEAEAVGTAGKAGEIAADASRVARVGAEAADLGRVAGEAGDLGKIAAEGADLSRASRAGSEASEIDAALERTFQGGRGEGEFETAARLKRGNLGERLATDSLAADGHTILSYKPSIMGTNQGGIDMVTMKDGVVYFVDNKALTRGGNVSSVSALTTNFEANKASALAELRAGIASAGSRGEADLLQNAVTAIENGNYRRVVTNANLTRNDAILSGVTERLTDEGIEFIDVFRPVGAQ